MLLSTITLSAVKVESGVVLHVVAVMNTIKTDSGNWWENTNFEFRLNRGVQRYLNINGASHGINDYFWNTENVGGKQVSTVEVYIANDNIPNWSAWSEIQVNYAWKTAGEVGYVVGNYTNFWASRDRWTGDSRAVRAKHLLRQRLAQVRHQRLVET